MRTYDQLVQEHEARFGPRLTMDEIAALDDEARVVIVWSGGNGPHEYTLLKRGDTRDVYLTRNVIVGTIDQCDLVWKAEAREPSRRGGE